MRDADNDEYFVQRDYDRDRRIWHAVHQLNERMVTMEASQAQNQASIDAETAQVQALGPKLDAIRVEVDALKNAQSQGQALDFSGLDAAVQAVGGQVDADQQDAAAVSAPAPTSDPAPASNPNPPAALDQPQQPADQSSQPGSPS